MHRLRRSAALSVACVLLAVPVLAETPGRWAGRDGELLPFVGDEEVLEFLRSAEIVALREIPVGVTEARVATLERDGIRLQAVFHDHHVVKQKVWLADGSFVIYFRDSYTNQVAACELGLLLGVTNIPPTVLRQVDGSEGSLQLWIENVRTEADRKNKALGFPDRTAAWRQVHDMNVFDALINNLDRTQRNFLWSRDDWDLWLIDHTRAFGRDTRVREPKTIRMISRRLWKALQEVEASSIDRELEPYMGKFERDAVISRRDDLVKLIRKKIEREGESEVLFGYDDPGSRGGPGG